MEISDFGRVKPCVGLISFGPKNVDEYNIVRISDKNYPVRQPVALAFIGKPPTNKHTVYHKDRDPANNHMSNIRWTTCLEQADNSKSRPIDAYKNDVFVDSYTSFDIASKDLDIHISSVSRCISGKYIQTGGYAFKLPTKDTIHVYENDKIKAKYESI